MQFKCLDAGKFSRVGNYDAIEPRLVGKTGEIQSRDQNTSDGGL